MFPARPDSDRLPFERPIQTARATVLTPGEVGLFYGPITGPGA